MPKIFYFTRNGLEYAKWPGVSKRTKRIVNGVERTYICKDGQRQLGRVLDKERNIFYKTDLGIYQFDVETQTDRELTPEELATVIEHRDGRRRNPPVIVNFGGSFFLDNLITGIQYRPVLDSIKYKIRDRLYAMLLYYLLSNGVAYCANTWYDNSYAKYLYPYANMASQRISEFLAVMGSDENRQNFLMSHIKYLLKSTDEELCMLVDSSGFPNKCKIPYTRVSNHDGDVNIEFRLIVVVQKSTGLPVYYEMIPGNVVDSNTLSTVMEKLKQYGYNVTYALGDAAYSCPSNIERIVLAGKDFLTRLNPAYDMFKNALDENIERLNDENNSFRFNGRMISIVKIESTIARKEETGEEVKGYIYLCRDMDAALGRCCRLLHSKVFKNMSDKEVQKEMRKYGVFALVSTKDIPEQDVLREYYMRQAIEQFFDYGKSYANYLPIRKHNEDTIKGHLLLSFIATFIIVLIKNRLKIVDSPYAAIPSSLADEDDGIPFEKVDTQQGVELMIRQEQLNEIHKSSPSLLFGELEFHRAEVFNGEIVTNVPTAGANAFYKAYRMDVPLCVILEKNGNITVPVPKYKDNGGNNCTRKLAFAKRSSLTKAQIEQRIKNGELKKLENIAAKLGIEISAISATKESTSTEAASKAAAKAAAKTGTKAPAKAAKTPAKVHEGNPESSKAENTTTATEEATAPKRGVGRPKGSKDKQPRKRRSPNQSNPTDASNDQEQQELLNKSSEAHLLHESQEPVDGTHANETDIPVGTSSADSLPESQAETATAPAKVHEVNPESSKAENTTTATEEATAPKRGVGRPKGSKDKQPRKRRSPNQSNPTDASNDQEQQELLNKSSEAHLLHESQEPVDGTHANETDIPVGTSSVDNLPESPAGGELQS